MADKNDIIIKAENLFFTYEDGTEALRGIDLEIKRGRRVAFLGANGSGKSTFFFCLNGLNRPNAGRLLFNGVPYAYDKKALLNLRSKVGIVFQDPDSQLFSASVYQEISFGAMNLELPQAEVESRVEQAIADLEITPFRDKPTHFLSGGQKKQVSIADILVMHPQVIVLDEPAAALDPKHTKIVNHLIDKLCERGITTIIATHDVDHAYEWADDVVLFHDGKVLLSGPPEEVFANEAALLQTNLEKPAALRLFDSLKSRGLLAGSLKPPRTLDALEEYIRQSVSGAR